MKRLIILNGPPRSGKDLACEYLYKEFPYAFWFRMSQPLKDMVHAMIGANEVTKANLERYKDVPDDTLFNYSYRQLQIYLSEHCLKPAFGKDVFGKLAARRIIQSQSKLFLCSDAGFNEEVAPITHIIKPKNILLIKISRPGTSFERDSRSYIDIPGATVYNICNDTDVATYKHILMTVVYEWLEQQPR